MTETTFNHQTTRVHDRTFSFSTRLKMALASGGVVCALFVGSLAGFHGVASAAKAQVAKTHTTTIVVKQTKIAVAPAQPVMATYSYQESNGGYRDIAYQAAVNAGINPNLFINQIQAESGFNPNAASGAGAVGIAQFMPATAASMGINPYDPTQALYGAARLMAGLNSQFGGDYAKALAAYNAGPGAVFYAVRAGGSNWRAFLPSESQNYIREIMG